MWDAWRGCRKHSEGCKFCYIFRRDKIVGIDTTNVVKTADFYKPLERFKNGNYKLRAKTVYLCFSSDFLIEEGDKWRGEIWNMIKERSDINYMFLTKRIERFMDCIPSDWGDGYDNVIVGVTIENQAMADKRLPIFVSLPIKHRIITAQPLISDLEIEKYLYCINQVAVGGESDFNARPLHYDWVLNIREQCIKNKVDFEFRQTGSNFIKDGKRYKILKKQMEQARLADINVTF